MTDNTSSFIGQQPLIDALVKVANQQVAYGHAYLLCGADTVTVAAIAAWLRNFLVCAEPQGEAACGKCPGCLSAMRGDGIWSYHLALDREEQAHSVERIRSIRQFVGLKAVKQGRRVVVVESVDTLRGAAANALLKNLEEPGQALAYILTATHPSAILPTIRSRAMMMSVQPVAAPVLVSGLVQLGYTRNAAIFASTFFPGQVGRAVQFLSDQARVNGLQELERLLASWQSLPVAQRLRLASGLLEGYADATAQRQRVHDVLNVVAARRTNMSVQLRALLNACLALRTNAAPKLIFDAFALQTL